MRYLSPIVLVVCLQARSVCQDNPVEWIVTAGAVKDGEATIAITGKIQKHWWVFAQAPASGIMPTRVTFTNANGYALEGELREEGVCISWHNQMFNRDFLSFQSVSYFQKVKVSAKQVMIKGTIDYMPHNKELCRNPERISFSVRVGGTG